MIWLLQRVVVQLIGLLVVSMAGSPSYAPGGFFGTFYRWDSGYFACIAAQGYLGQDCQGGSGLERVAFFPLYPMLSSAVAWLVSAGAMSTESVTFGLWLVAAAASIFAVIGVYRIAEHRFDQGTARRAAALFLFSPYAVFLVASYSESLYLAAAVWAWYFCLRRRYLLTGVLGIVASASRASGMFLIIALLVLYLLEARRMGKRVRILDLVAIGSGSAGVIAYWVWLYFATGDLLAWFHAQSEGWHRRTRWPWETLLNQGIHVLREPRWDWQMQAILEVGAAIVIAVAIILFVRRKEWASATLVGTTAVSLMTSNSYLSLARNTLTLFPLFILLADWTRGPRRRWFWVLFASGCALLVFNTVQLALGNWAD
nr:mannosyltransferase family protein [Microbacterium lemovicicum]